MTPQQEVRLAQALHHVELGFWVLPCWSTYPDGRCKCGKDHTKNPKHVGKHPYGTGPNEGFRDATNDPERVKTFMSAASEPNYGIVWPDGADVVLEWDVDGEDWKAKIEGLKAKYGPLPKTKTTRSPSGGLHVFYRWPDGVPVPDGARLHGFLVRWPWKGYVVGPGSRINGRTYESVGGTEDIATLPVSWAVTEAVRGSEPLITVVGDQPSYEVPTGPLAEGERYDAVLKYTASRWNKGVGKAEVVAGVQAVIAPLFNPAKSDAEVLGDIDRAWDTLAKKFGEPAARDHATPVTTVTTDAGTEIDPLAIEMRIERPAPLDMTKVPMPTGIAMLLDHLTPITDAPFSSLTLASVVGLAGLMGPKPTLRWRGTQRLILFGALVGDSNYARKGQTISEVMATLTQIDEPMMSLIREPYIPSSGPAFIETLAESKGQSVLMVTTEMGKVLAMAAREGETLSYDMRDAWDGVAVGGRTRKTGKISAANYHLSILGATTPEDLVAKLTDTDLRNGWANRWLWFWAEKRPGGFDEEAINRVDPATIAFIRDGIEFARGLGGSMLIKPDHTMVLTAAASAYLAKISADLDVPAHGTVGVLRQRMPPIAVRIAMVAACLDQTREIEIDHLDFGFALTDYAVQSIRAVFGTRIDDEVAKTILDILRQTPDGWLNTSTIAKAIRKDGSRTNRALQALLDAGLIVREDRKTAGRTANGYVLRAF